MIEILHLDLIVVVVSCDRDTTGTTTSSRDTTPGGIFCFSRCRDLNLFPPLLLPYPMTPKIWEGQFRPEHINLGYNPRHTFLQVSPTGDHGNYFQVNMHRLGSKHTVFGSEPH